jgi:hypothetical protein
MQQKKVFVVAICLLMMGLNAQARAVAIRMPSIAERVSTADAVVVGKVESIEEKTVKAKSLFGDEIEYQIAVVKVKDSISGAKGETHIKVGFQLLANPNPGGGRPIRPGRGFAPPKLEKDQEVCLLLQKHPTETFFVLTTPFQIIDKKDENFDKQVDEVKKLAKLLDDADKSLKSKEKDDRFLAAAMLITKYRTPIGASQATEEVNADQSKAILNALAEADWKKQYPELQGWNAMTVFYHLNLTEKDGWKFPQNANEQQVIDAAKGWLKDNAEKYHIQKFVAEKKDDKKDK